VKVPRANKSLLGSVTQKDAEETEEGYMLMRKSSWHKELVMSNPFPGGCAFSAASILTEPPHLLLKVMDIH
jgi:hypothetical protein